MTPDELTVALVEILMNRLDYREICRDEAISGITDSVIKERQQAANDTDAELWLALRTWHVRQVRD